MAILPSRHTKRSLRRNHQDKIIKEAVCKTGTVVEWVVISSKHYCSPMFGCKCETEINFKLQDS